MSGSGLMSGGGDTPPYDLSHDAFDVTFPPPGQTDVRENITFPKLRLQVVNITY